MSLHKEDARSKKIIFVANCLLNANNKVLEIARYGGMFKEVVEVLVEQDIGVIQMPCPETLYAGNQRWHTTRNLYDNAGYRRFCRQMAEPMVDYMENYKKIGYQVLGILTCDGSPSCGITKSSYSEDWGGKPKAIPRVLVDKPGIFMEELMALIESRGLKLPEIYGLPMDNYEKTTEEIIKEFKNWAKEKIANGDNATL